MYSFKKVIIVKRLPKTRSGKILRGISFSNSITNRNLIRIGTMGKIANNEEFKMPATIDDPAILDEIKEALIELHKKELSKHK